MSDEDKATESAIAKLQNVDGADFVIFSAEEATALREVAKVWRQVRGAVAIGGALGTFLKWLVVIGAAIAAIRAGALDWLKGP